MNCNDLISRMKNGEVGALIMSGVARRIGIETWHSLFKGLINYLTTSLDTLLCPLIVTFSI